MTATIVHEGISLQDFLKADTSADYEKRYNTIRDRVSAELERGWKEGQPWVPKEIKFLPTDDPRAVTDLINGARVYGWQIRQERRADGLVYIFEGNRNFPSQDADKSR